MRKRLVAVALPVIAALITSATPAGASTTPTTSTTIKVTFAIGNSALSKSKTAGKTVLRSKYASITPKMKKEEHSKKCQWVPYLKGNGAYTASGSLTYISWPYKTEICPSKSSPTGWIKVNSKDNTGFPKDCHNPAIPPWQHSPAHLIPVKQVVVVASFTSISVGVYVQSTQTQHVSLTMGCVVPGGGGAVSLTFSATASGSAHASASATAKTYAKAKATATGKASIGLSSKASVNASANATSQAKIQFTASVTCESTTIVVPPSPKCSDFGPGYIGNYPACYKDGTTTPPPPPSAPGPNPTDPPTGAPGGSGSNQCYSESTGQPVQPNQDGTCPPGSYGA